MAKNEWKNLAAPDQTFQSFYNEFSKYMTKFKIMPNPNNRTNRLVNMNTGQGRGRYCGGGGRDRDRGRSRSRGQGRDRGRDGQDGHNSFNPYDMAR